MGSNNRSNAAGLASFQRDRAMERAGKFSARRVKCSIAKETPSLGCSPAPGYNLTAKAVKGKNSKKFDYVPGDS